MNYQQILNQMFGESNHNVTINGDLIFGEANKEQNKFFICGIINEAQLDNQMCITLADYLISHANSIQNLIILVDTGGQKTTHYAELIGLNSYIAHLIKVIYYLRLSGVRVFSIVTGKALGGAFIGTSLNAEKIYALDNAQIAVMWLDAMSRVTKIPVHKLEELSKSSAIFAPGAENYIKLGVVEEIRQPQMIMNNILESIKESPVELGYFRENGFQNGGRTLAKNIIERILST